MSDLVILLLFGLACNLIGLVIGYGAGWLKGAYWKSWGNE